jgi:hypothetical protein
MHCSNCGSYLAPGVRFCSGCGSPANDPEATRIARTQRGIPARLDEEDDIAVDDDLEAVIFTVRPTLVFIKLGYALAVVGAIALVFLLALLTPIPPYISILLAMSLLLIPAYYHVKRNMVRYTLTDSKIEIDTGLIARTTRNIPSPTATRFRRSFNRQRERAGRHHGVTKYQPSSSSRRPRFARTSTPALNS